MFLSQQRLWRDEAQSGDKRPYRHPRGTNVNADPVGFNPLHPGRGAPLRNPFMLGVLPPAMRFLIEHATIPPSTSQLHSVFSGRGPTPRRSLTNLPAAERRVGSRRS